MISYKGEYVAGSNTYLFVKISVPIHCNKCTFEVDGKEYNAEYILRNNSYDSPISNITIKVPINYKMGIEEFMRWCNDIYTHDRMLVDGVEKYVLYKYPLVVKREDVKIFYYTNDGDAYMNSITINTIPSLLDGEVTVLPLAVDAELGTHLSSRAVAIGIKSPINHDALTIFDSGNNEVIRIYHEYDSIYYWWGNGEYALLTNAGTSRTVKRTKQPLLICIGNICPVPQQITNVIYHNNCLELHAPTDSFDISYIHNSKQVYFRGLLYTVSYYTQQNNNWIIQIEE